jgi:hypothetical protein
MCPNGRRLCLRSIPPQKRGEYIGYIIGYVKSDICLLHYISDINVSGK